LASRVRSGEHRPLLDGDPLATLTRLAAERDGWYGEVADEVVDVGTGGSAAVVERILALVGARS
jgi:shikimate kinase